MQTQRLDDASVKKFIILDDSQFDRTRLKRTLKELALPVAVQEVDCLLSFKSTVVGSIFDLAIVDYDLPDGTGCDALKYLLENQPTPSIMITGNTAPSVSEIARRYGCTECLSKTDLSGSSLKIAISSALGTSDSNQVVVDAQ